MILFLFVVMMLDLKHNKLKVTRLHLPTGVLIGSISFFYIGNRCAALFFESKKTVFFESDSNIYVNWQVVLEQNSDVTVLGDIFYHNYVAQILMAGILLYTSTIGVVFLTSNKHRAFSIKNTQSLTKQLSRSRVL